MTDETRDLDRACAEAMGWTTQEFSSATALVRGKELVWQPPHYSTDPSTQAEKLRWLHENADYIVLGVRRGSVEVVASSDVHGWSSDGATIDEALARLICSVAKAKKEQGK